MKTAEAVIGDKRGNEFDSTVVRRDLVNLEDMIVDKYAEVRAMDSGSEAEVQHVLTAEEAASAETLLRREDLIEVIADAITRRVTSTSPVNRNSARESTKCAGNRPIRRSSSRSSAA